VLFLPEGNSVERAVDELDRAIFQPALVAAAAARSQALLKGRRPSAEVTLAVGAAFALAAGLLAAAAAAEGSPVVFHGNVAILDDVYETVLDLPADAKATPQTAREVEEKLTSFLHRSGYDLAVVRARAGGGRVDVDIDEGTLDKVIVLGSDVVTCLRLRLNLSMAGRVYNRPELERRLREAAKT